jgi:hypothetical protein
MTLVRLTQATAIFFVDAESSSLLCSSMRLT